MVRLVCYEDLALQEAMEPYAKEPIYAYKLAEKLII